MGPVYYALKGAAIALAVWMTSYGSFLSYQHFGTWLWPTIAVTAAVGLGIALHVWRQHLLLAIVLGIIGLAAAAVSTTVVIDRTIASHAEGVQAARDRNHPLAVAEQALEDAKAEHKQADNELKAARLGGQCRVCKELSRREAEARERLEQARAKLAGMGAKTEEDPAATQMAALIGISPELYRTLQSIAPSVLLEIAAPFLMAFGLRALPRERPQLEATPARSRAATTKRHNANVATALALQPNSGGAQSLTGCNA